MFEARLSGVQPLVEMGAGRADTPCLDVGQQGLVSGGSALHEDDRNAGADLRRRARWIERGDLLARLGVRSMLV
jgi:hypothetical protein